MPRRQDLETILILGSGPIVIGQACEFDYSGSCDTDGQNVMAEALRKHLEFELPRNFFPDYKPGKGAKFLS